MRLILYKDVIVCKESILPNKSIMDVVCFGCYSGRTVIAAPDGEPSLKWLLGLPIKHQLEKLHFILSCFLILLFKTLSIGPLCPF